MIKEFNNEIYPRKLWVAVTCDGEELKGFTTRDNKPIDFSDVTKGEMLAYTIKDVQYEDYYGYLVVFYSTREMIDKYIAHEAIHVLSGFLGDVNIMYDEHNDEPVAYLFEWIFDSIQSVKNQLLYESK